MYTYNITYCIYVPAAENGQAPEYNGQTMMCYRLCLSKWSDYICVQIEAHTVCFCKSLAVCRKLQGNISEQAQRLKKVEKQGACNLRKCLIARLFVKV